MGDMPEFVLVAVSIMAALGAVGRKIAKKQNRSPFLCCTLCAMIPLVGIGLLLLVGPKSEKQGG